MEGTSDEVQRKRKSADNIPSPDHSTEFKMENDVSNSMTDKDSRIFKKPRCLDELDGVTVSSVPLIHSSEESILHGVELNPDVVELVNVTDEEEEEANKSLNDLLGVIDNTSCPAGTLGSAQLVMVCDADTGGVMTVYGLDSESSSSLSDNGLPASRLPEDGGSYLGGSVTHPFEGSLEIRNPNACENNQYTFPCHDCGKVFTSQRGRLIHRRRFHYKSREDEDANELLESQQEGMNSVESDRKCLLSMLLDGSNGWAQPHTASSNPSSVKHPDEQNLLEIYACSQCDSVYLSEKSRIMHERSAHGRSSQSSGSTKSKKPRQDKSSGDPAQGPFRCSKCSLLFPSELEHRLHFNRAHVQVNRYLCNECDKRFQFRHDLRLHKEAVHYKASAEEHCTCSETTHPEPEATPVATSGQGTLETFACNLCSRTFDKMEHLKSHLQSEHYSAAMPFSCDVCGTKFISSNRLDEHVRLKHMNVKKLQCPCCDKKFRNAWVLKTHLSSESTHRCPKCNKKYKSAVDILNQLKKNLGDTVGLPTLF